eukprot:6195604-Pleurochrysis_carterae.AAC.1
MPPSGASPAVAAASRLFETPVSAEQHRACNASGNSSMRDSIFGELSRTASSPASAAAAQARPPPPPLRAVPQAPAANSAAWAASPSAAAAEAAAGVFATAPTGMQAARSASSSTCMRDSIFGGLSGTASNAPSRQAQPPNAACHPAAPTRASSHAATSFGVSPQPGAAAAFSPDLGDMFRTAPQRAVATPHAPQAHPFQAHQPQQPMPTSNGPFEPLGPSPLNRNFGSAPWDSKSFGSGSGLAAHEQCPTPHATSQPFASAAPTRASTSVDDLFRSAPQSQQHAQQTQNPQPFDPWATPPSGMAGCDGCTSAQNTQFSTPGWTTFG